MSIEVDVQKFHEEGYLIFRNVFDKNKIAEYRRKLDAAPPFEADLIGEPDFCELVVDPVIIGIARKILGSQPTYFGFSSISRATTAGTASWHRDNADRFDFKAPDWTGGPYTMIRFGIYMQDHKNNSGGLLLRPNTHRADSVGLKTLLYVDTQPGDLAVWNMRILHAGGGKRLRSDPERSIDIPEAAKIAPEDFLPEPEGARYAAFITYGLSGDEHTERYLDYLSTRKFMTDLWSRAKVCDRAKELLANADVHYRDVWSEIKDRPGIGANAGHVEKAHLKGETKGLEIAASH